MRYRVFLVLTLVLSAHLPTGKADVIPPLVNVPENEDAWISYENDLSVTATDYIIRLTRYTDNNGNGILNTQQLISVTETGDCSALSAHMACDIDLAAGGDALILWKANSTHHTRGNYEIEVIYRNAVGGTLTQTEIPVTLVLAPATESAVTSHESSRNSHLSGAETNVTANVDAKSRDLGARMGRDMINLTQEMVRRSAEHYRHQQNETDKLVIRSNDREDIDIQFFDPGTNASIAKFDLTLIEFDDKNDDGDYLDAQEKVTQLTANQATSCLSIMGHFSCEFNPGDERILYMQWREESTLHVAGNYSLRIDFLDTNNNLVRRQAIAVDIEDFRGVNFTDSSTTTNVNVGGGAADDLVLPLFYLVFLMFAMSRGHLMLSLFATVGLLSTQIEGFFLGFAGILLFMVIGLWIDFAARDGLQNAIGTLKLRRKRER